MLGQADAARDHYVEYLDFNEAFAAPATLRTPVGEAVGIRYNDDPGPLDTRDQARFWLSEMIYCEARGESDGGMAAVGDPGCAVHHLPTGCGVYQGKVCGNGGSDHCFYSVE